MPSDREAVKLLTVHRAKGLEWEVGLPAGPDARGLPERPGDRQLGDQPGGAAGRAARRRRRDPAARGRHATPRWRRTRRSCASSSCWPRTGWPTSPRPGRSSCWSAPATTWRADLANRADQSDYLETIMAAAQAAGSAARPRPDRPGPAQNPLVVEAAPQPWPQPLDPDARPAGRRRPLAVDAGAASTACETGSYDDPEAYELLLDGEDVVGRLGRRPGPAAGRGGGARSGRQQVLLPAELSATRGAAAGARTRRRSRRSWPGRCRGQPSRAARFGTRFHGWVERQFAGRLPSRWARSAAAGRPRRPARPRRLRQRRRRAELRELCRAFAAGCSATACRTRSRRRSASWSAAGWSAAGSTRCTNRPEHAETRDRGSRSSTGRPSAGETADPLQLAIYRLAWAESPADPGRAGGRGVLLRADGPAGPAGASCPIGTSWRRC